MKYNSIAPVEEAIVKTGNNGEYDLRKFSIPVPGENISLNGFLTTPKNRAQYYYDVEHPKERIVLHFTAGNIRSDLGALTRDNYHVSVAFVIGRSGVIYQLFSSKFWSGHIGQGVGNTNTGNAQDKVTIGIELSNYGFLTEREGNLETYYSRQKDDLGKVGPVDVYCSVADKQAFTKVDQPFREQSYYATFTDEQYDSLIVLLRYLTTKYNISRQFLPVAKRFQTLPEVTAFKGIVSHINYRRAGKWDIGPAFDWNTVINGLQAPVFTPRFSESENGFENVGNELNSEDQFDHLLPQAKDASHEDEGYEEIVK